ncbi:phospholipase D-like domain-containing protein [Nocardioides stalactiti]|uniref:phospholipase D-like domain-containing protein n=1 Tax=Nocardioides stalactiti TaxID=2755356 RepID=UPI0015FF51CD|nr:phospholipase D-like domain-containing protein [Nocardioides stalactiti]
MRRAVVLLAVLLPFTLLNVPAGAYAPGGYEPGGGASFNVPEPWGSEGENSSVIRKVEEAFNHVRPTAKDPRPVILVTNYLFDRKKSADALIAACRRGVSVRVIIDRDVVSRPFRKLVTMLNADNVRDRDNNGIADNDPRSGRCNRSLPDETGGLRVQSDPDATEIPVMSPREVTRSITEDYGADVTWGKDRSYVLKCAASCRGAGGETNMHSKIYAMSNSGSARWVTMTSSSNLNAGGANKGWNDLVVMKNRPNTFAFLVKIHRLMTRQKKAGGKLVEFVDGPYTTRIFPMVGVGKDRDPLMVDLRKVKCTSSFGPTQLYIQQFWWNGHRGNYIWDRIRNMAQNGCKVHIIFGAVDSSLLSRMRAARASGLIELWDSRIDTNQDSCVDTRTHMKNIAVRGTYGRDRRYSGVWTGTANWATGSLTKGDEITLNVRSASLYREYVERWQVVKNHSSLRWSPGPREPGFVCPD